MADGPSAFDRMNQGQLGGSQGGGPTKATDGNPAIGSSAPEIALHAVTGGAKIPNNDYGFAGMLDTKGVLPLDAPPGTAIGGQQPGKIATFMEKIHAQIKELADASAHLIGPATHVGADSHPAPMDNNPGGFAGAVSSSKSGGGHDGP